MVSSSIHNDWAKSLVGRDWEIFWVEEKDSDKNADDDDDSTAMEVDDNKRNKSTGEDDDSSSEGSIIDDWYAGHVLSLECANNGVFTFKVRFVGDEEIYAMALEPSKVRPSARGWIKRTKALLCSTGHDYQARLPPDTSMIDDQIPLNNLREEVGSYKYESFHLREQKGGFQAPCAADIDRILQYRYLLRAQILLRTRLSTIVNHHGSTKYVDGEPNPTESYVEHLWQCCKDMDLVCGWFLRCWELLASLFSKTSDADPGSPSPTDGLNIDRLFHEYLEYGKISIVNCATMDVSPTASKRRLLAAETSSARRPKRRRKISRWGSGGTQEGIDTVADECDLRLTSSVDTFVNTLHESTDRWFQHIFARMLQTISHFVVDPVIRWQQKSRQLIGETSELLVKLEKEEGVDAANATGSTDEHGDDEQNSSDDESLGETFFSLEEIESCYALTQSNPVLMALDLGEEVGKLKKKIGDITMSAAHAVHLLKSLACKTNAKSKNEDDVLVGLTSISDAAQTTGSSLFNVEPIGKYDCHVTREFLSSAINFRSFLLDVWHSRQVRERYAFVEDLANRSMNLPDLSSGLGLFDESFLAKVTEEAKLEIKKIHGSLAEHAGLIGRYESELESKVESQKLMSQDGLTQAMKELAKCPAVSLVEEKISVRADILDWFTEAKSVFEDDDNDQCPLGYEKLERLSKDLQSITTGSSRRRKQLTKDTEINAHVDRIVCSFAADDSIAICKTLVSKINEVHSKATEWKDRAESSIMALRAYGNSAAGEVTNPAKLPAMVDMRRIHDLLEEYSLMKVDIAGVKTILERIRNEANDWSACLLSTIVDKEFPLDDCLSFLETQRDCRPRGIIMDPTRTVFDSVLDLLVWHTRVKDCLNLFTQVSDDVSTSETDIDERSSLLQSTLYLLLAEGMEVLEAYNEASANGDIVNTWINADHQNCLRVLEDLHGIRKSARAISKDRLESHPLGSAIISRIVNPVEDINQKCPLLAMRWVQWHVCVSQLVHDYGEISDDDCDVDREAPSNIRSLSEAKELFAMQPSLPIENDASPGFVSLARTKSPELKRLDHLIQEAETKEHEIRELLQKSKEMLRGAIRKNDAVRKHLAQLKESHITFKGRLAGEGGLSLDPAIEPQLDQHIKIFTWLIRTFAYPLLHLDEATYSLSNDAIDSNQRIPFDVLISLYDRMPCAIEKQANDFALVSLRVSELYDGAKKWQDEITKNTTLSFRGGKRRTQSGAAGSPSSSEQDQEASSKVKMEQMKKLAENPILSKVAMPRENAVNGILESSSQFEVELENFLGKDYIGCSPDRAPFPGKKSLVGESGEFILYRLTGSPLFGELQSSLKTLSDVGGGLLAETPGKATFDWIKEAVAWIERLLHGISCDSPFESAKGNVLVIRAQEAREILKHGENIFLTIPEDLKRTLSQHGIFVTTNRNDKTIRVSLKKDGAHHSIGGTVIRWCPILFECLKADIARLDDWERALTEILSDFNAFFSETRQHPKSDKKNLYQWYCYREQVCDLMDEGRESLIIAPQKGLVESFQNLLTSINNYLKKHCKPELEAEFSKKWFAQSTSLVDDRFRLLDALIYRTSAAEGQQFPIPNNAPGALEPERNFRDTCRGYIEAGLIKAAKAIGLKADPDTSEHGDISSCCAVVAWDIEREMFERFQADVGVSRVSQEYRTKARSLRCSLEDKNNISLCLRILTGEIDAAKLVYMSSEELASQKAKSKRARAEQEAKYHANLTPKLKQDQANKTQAADDSKKVVQKVATIQPKVPPDTIDRKPKAEKKPILKSVLRVPKHVATTPPEAAPRVATASSNSSDSVYSTKPSLVTSNARTNAEKIDSPSSLKALMKASKKNRPPPPPSLAASFQITPSPPTQSSNRGIRVVSADGKDSFRVEIGNPRSGFFSAFYLENESFMRINNFLSDILGERGRLRIEEFSRFLRDKLSGGRWLAIPLRLATISEEDAQEYKKFYKDYEMRNRIAMFYVGQNSKMFLVTPKFHDAARSAGLDTLSNRTSTYAVILTKEIMLS